MVDLVKPVTVSLYPIRVSCLLPKTQALSDIDIRQIEWNVCSVHIVLSYYLPSINHINLQRTIALVKWVWCCC